MCDNADLPALFATVPSDDRLALLQGRIRTCRTLIKAASPTPGPLPPWVPTPTPTPTTNPDLAACNADSQTTWLAEYEVLGRCVAYMKALPSPPATPSPGYLAANRTAYVFSIGGADPTTSALLVRSVTAQLNALPHNAGVRVVGRLDWSAITSFTAQCQSDTNTIGAIVIENSYPQAFTYNYLALLYSAEQVAAQAEILGCSSFDHTPASSTLALWATAQPIERKHGENTFAVGPLAAIVSLFSGASTTTTVQTSPTPIPNTTPPQYSSSSTVEQKFTPAFIVGTLSAAVSTVNAPAANASNQLIAAARAFAGELVPQMSFGCATADYYTGNASYFNAHPTAVPSKTTMQSAYMLAELCSDLGLRHPPKEKAAR